MVAELSLAQGPLLCPIRAGVVACEGIPYAAPPIGHLRWRSPMPAPRSNATLNASAPGACCTEAEDCLHINVYAPAGAEALGLLPTMVFIHGGAFITGCGSDYAGDRLARASWRLGSPVVVVTLNYRLGALGFLGGDALRTHEGGGGTGNFGLEDQRFALRWVSQNVGAFGGDAGRVTIFGESAGAASVSCHVVSAPSRGLFDGAIIESGAFQRWSEQRREKEWAVASSVGW